MEFQEWHCGGEGCDRLLGEVDVTDGRIRRVCDKCGAVNVLQARPSVSYEELLRHLLNQQARGSERVPTTTASDP